MMCRKFLLLTLLAMSPILVFGKTTFDARLHSAPFSVAVDSCDLSAPTNFQVKAIGPTWVTLTWMPTALGVDHRIKTFRVSDGALVSNIVVGAAMAPMVTINGLQQDETYQSKICAICPDGTDSKYFTLSPNYDTLIGELIVSGVTESNGSGTCGIRNLGQYCEFKLDGSTNIFKARPIVGSTYRQFNIRKQNVDGQDILRVIISGNNHPYVFTVDDLIDPQGGDNVGVKGKVFEITISGNVVAAFELSEHFTVNLDGHITWSIGPTGYEIIRLTSGPNGFAGSGGGILTDTKENELETEQVAVVSPNPFTDQLEVYLANNEAENVSLQLYNLSGQKVMDQRYDSTQEQYSLSTATLSPGFYMLRIEADGAVQTIKVVKAE